MVALQLNDLLVASGLRLTDTRLMRHQQALEGGLTPYYLWREYPEDFLSYQNTQSPRKRITLNGASHWASFVATPTGDTLFVGVFSASFKGLLDRDVHFRSDRTTKAAGSCDEYESALADHLLDYIGRLRIDWGAAARSWIQYPHRQPKQITGLSDRRYSEEFPGYLRFRKRLSEVPLLPDDWKLLLRQAKGVYLLTCPRTREQYVGSAYGGGGFYERWLTHFSVGGDAVGLQSREPSDYQISILEVTGSTLGFEDIIAIEALWMSKLQSREMGLN